MALVCSLDLELCSRKLTTKEFATSVGINETSVRKLRLNRFSMIDAKNLEKICVALGLQPGDLLHIELD